MEIVETKKVYDIDTIAGTRFPFFIKLNQAESSHLCITFFNVRYNNNEISILRFNKEMIDCGIGTVGKDYLIDYDGKNISLFFKNKEQIAIFRLSFV